VVALQLPVFRVQPAVPAEAGIVVIHEGGGMTLQVLRFAERLAAEGYAVAAPDLFFRTGGPAARADYTEQLGPLYEHRDQTFGDLAAAAAALRADGAQRIGVTGFCMGGSFTWLAALHTDVFDAAVSFYGSYVASELGRPRCPTLVLFGEDDPWVPLADAQKVAAFHPDTVIYPGAGHGFMRDGTDDFVEGVAADAWGRMLSHFGEHLASSRAT
jgi:carboxymethylenebutenolidase